MDSSIINTDAISRLEEWGGGDLVQQMVRLFLQNSPERLEQIRTAFGDDPGGLPERGAHSLKSSAANIGAEGVRDVAAKIEAAAADGNLDAVRDLVPELQTAFDHATRALEELLEGYQQ